MDWYLAALLIMGAFLVLLAIGMPISFSFAVVGAGGLLLMKGPQYLSRLPQVAHESVNSFVLTAIPLFILMAEILAFTGISGDLFTAVERWLGRLPGGLAVSSILACAGFGAVSGSSAATAAAIGSVAMPEMLKRGYSKSLAAGAVSTGGTLGLMIPPSLSFIIYGFMAQQSIPKLFIAGIIPGVILAIIFSIYILVHCSIDRRLAPLSVSSTWGQRVSSVLRVWPILLLAAIIMVGIYRGWFTPTEAAAAGVVVVLCYAAIYRKLTWQNLKGALLRTAVTSGFILFIIIGAMSFATLLAQMRIPRELSQALTQSGASPLMVFVGVVILYFILGMFMEGVSIMTLTIPIIVPVMAAMGYDLIWFGVIVTLLVELALITPPVGVNCFVIAGIAKPLGVSLEETFKGIIPYVFLMLIGVALFTAYPQIATWLPSAMK